MRLIFSYLLLFTVGFTALLVMMLGDSKPEIMIVGTWQEVSWEYESLSKDSDYNDIHDQSYADELSEYFGQNLLLHENERWLFMPNGKLIVQTADGQIKSEVIWKLKSRGDVLVFKENGEITESYQLTKLNKKQMVLNYNLDIQARGVAKLTFEKVY
jgi:hypothetical protein